MNERYQVFLMHLAALKNGDRAALKRSSGNMLSEVDGKAVTAFYRCLPNDVPHWQESRWFAVACLYCLWDSDTDNVEPIERIVGKMIRSEELSASTGHRVEVLLDTAWDDDGYMLTKLVRLAKLVYQKSNRSAIDFSALLDDLIYWNAENQSVQRKWARSIFAVNN